MLEVLYEQDSKIIRAWNADDSTQGNFKPKAGQAIILLPGEPPIFDSDVYYVDLKNRQVVANPSYIQPPDPKAEWQAARTEAEKLAVLARRLGLE